MRRVLFEAALSGPESSQAALLLIWMGAAAILFMAILLTVAVADRSALGPTASGEVSAVAGGLGVMIGRLFK